MRVLSRSCLIAILIAGLLNFPVFAANEAPLGLVTQAQSAQIGNNRVEIGTTIFPGDILATEVGGTLRLKFGTNQLYLLSSSSAGQGTIIGPQEVVISAYRGTLVLEYNGEFRSIPAGKSYRVTMDLEPAADP